MWKKQRPHELHETYDTNKATKSHTHSNLIDRFLRNWYEIESQDEDEEVWLNGAIISRTLITYLMPPSKWLPEIKLENKEIFWRYISKTDVFEPYDEPALKFKAFKKLTTLWSQFGQYEEIDLWE